VNNPTPIERRFARHTSFLALSFAKERAGTIMLNNKAMTAITTKSSIKVKPNACFSAYCVWFFTCCI